MFQLKNMGHLYRHVALVMIANIIGIGYSLAPQPLFAATAREKASTISHCVAQKPILTSVNNTQELKQVLTKYNYNFKAVKKGKENVPRLYCSNLPKDFKSIRSPQKKQEIFLQIMLPMILRVNEQILNDRQRIVHLKAYLQTYDALRHDDQQWLYGICGRYKLGYGKRPNFDELLRRVDSIPPSLALAQSIIESGWGDSKAARVNNSPFGISPADRVAFYQNLYDSVDAYMHTINTHVAYKNMRRTRSKLRQQGNAVSGDYLANDLTRYSVLKKVYVSKLQHLIKKHNLKQYDALRLRHASYVM